MDAHAEPDGGHSVQMVRGRIDAGLTNELVEFWTGHELLDREAAWNRVEEVICLLRDGEGAIVAVNSAFNTRSAELGDWWVWSYRTVAVTDAARASSRALLAAARRQLAGEFGGEPGEPVGIAWWIPGGAPIPGLREPVWPESESFLAGIDGGGNQLRVSWFEPPRDASFPLDERYEVRPPRDRDAEEAVRLWVAEAELEESEARRRTAEIVRVGIGPDGELCGVSTAYREHNPKVGVELWHIRAFVTPTERLSNLATNLLTGAWEDVSGRYASGEDRAAAGAAIEIENLDVAEAFPEPIWSPTLFAFVGKRADGAHVRVRWFEGAELPG